VKIVAAARAAWSAFTSSSDAAKPAVGPGTSPTPPATPPATPTAPAAVAAAASPTNPYQAGNDQIRKTATWLIGALAAVAAILLAGSQVSSIGKLPADGVTGRLTVAGLSAALAIGTVVYSIYRLTLVLAPVTTPLRDLRTEAGKPNSQIVDIATSDTGLTAGYPTIKALLDKYDKEREQRLTIRAEHQKARKVLADAVSETAKEAAKDAVEKVAAAEKQADADVAELRRYVLSLSQFLGYLTVSNRFADERRKVLVAAVVGAAAIIAFAWAANPAAPPAGTVAALPKSPVAVTVVLTPAGVEELSSLLGAACLKEAAAGTPAIALSASSQEAELVLTDTVSCAGPRRLTLETRLARVEPADAVTLP
jgi:hypothetical protein